MSLAKLRLTQLAQHGELLSRYGASIRVLGQRDLVKPDVLEAIDRAVALTKDNGDAVLNVCFPYTSRDEITTAVRGVVEDWSLREDPDVGVGVGKRGEKFSERHIALNIRSRCLSAAGAQARGLSPTGAGSDPEDAHSAAVSTSSTLQVGTPPNILPQGGGDEEGDREWKFPDPEAIDVQTLNWRMLTAGMPPLDLLVRTSGVERLSDFMLWQVHDGAEVEFLECMWPEFDLWSFLPVLVEWQWRRRKEAREGKPMGRVGARSQEALKAQ